MCVHGGTLRCDRVGGINSPPATSHAAMTPEKRVRIGITEALRRLFVGIEDTGDLIDDLREAIGS